MKLVVNADDFGLSKEVNDGIIEGFDKGIITSASILANYPLKLPERKKLGLGVHLNITWGNSLVDGKKFPSNMLTRATLMKTQPGFVEKEFRQQIELLQDLGYKLDHLNTHQHIHVIPPLNNIVYKLAREYKIKYVRYPNEKLTKINKNIISYSIAKYHMEIARKFPNDLATSKEFFGFMDTGNPSLKNYLSYLNFKDTAEICCHPSKGLSTKGSKLTSSRQKELKILTNKTLKEQIKRKKIKLVRCKELW